MFDGAAGNQTLSLTTSGMGHCCVALSDTIMAAGCNNGNVNLLDIDTGDCVGRFRAHTSVASVAVSPDGLLLVGSAADVVSVWRVPDDVVAGGAVDEGTLPVPKGMLN